MTTTETKTPTDPREELVQRLFDASTGALEMLTVCLGESLGLYRTLRDDGAATIGELAARAGIANRYAQEWLEGQAASGFLEVDDVAAAPEQRRFSISDAYAEVLTDPDSLYYAFPLAQMVGLLGPMLPRLTSVFRTGEGIPLVDYGAESTDSQADFNRPWLRARLGREALPSIPDVHERLTSGPARVADLACGAGWAGIAIAEAYPLVTVDGFDADAYSIDLARQNAVENGLTDRVRFTVHDVAQPISEGRYDLAVVIEAVHDLSRPVEFLAAVHRMLAPGAVAIVADEKTAEMFTAPGEPLERLLYATSVLSCLPCGLAEQPSAATGAVMRPAVLRRYAAAAGFSRVTVLEDIEHDMFRFYRLDP